MPLSSFRCQLRIKVNLLSSKVFELIRFEYWERKNLWCFTLFSTCRPTESKTDDSHISFFFHMAGIFFPFHFVTFATLENCTSENCLVTLLAHFGVHWVTEFSSYILDGTDIAVNELWILWQPCAAALQKKKLCGYLKEQWMWYLLEGSWPYSKDE